MIINIVSPSLILLIFFLSITHLLLQLSQQQQITAQSQIQIPPNSSLDSTMDATTNSTAASDSTQQSVLAEPIIGSFGDDRISGTNNTDIIIGLLGSDTIRGEGGDDIIQGNEDLDK